MPKLHVAGGTALEVETHREAIVKRLRALADRIEGDPKEAANAVVVALGYDDGSVHVVRYAFPNEAIGIMERAKAAIVHYDPEAD